MNEAMITLEEQFFQYRISEALMTVYKLLWDDFCSWYLEMIKPAYQHPIDQDTFTQTIRFFDDLMRLLHPFMPFITEEIWHNLEERRDNESIMTASLPATGTFNQELIDLFAIEEEVIISIRKLRAEKNLPNKESIELFIRKNNQEEPDHTFDEVIAKLCNVNKISYVVDKVQDASSFIVRSTEFYVPLASSLDRKAELDKLKEELNYTKGFLSAVNKKLSNERFVKSAPSAVVEKELKKKADAESRIRVIEGQISALN
jgi:valyl-tRNA synthetase